MKTGQVKGRNLAGRQRGAGAPERRHAGVLPAAGVRAWDAMAPAGSTHCSESAGSASKPSQWFIAWSLTYSQLGTFHWYNFFIRKYVNKASHRKLHMFSLKMEWYTVSRVTFILLEQIYSTSWRYGIIKIKILMLWKWPRASVLFASFASWY